MNVFELITPHGRARRSALVIRRIKALVVRGVGNVRQSVELVRILRAWSEESEAEWAAFRPDVPGPRRARRARRRERSRAVA